MPKKIRMATWDRELLEMLRIVLKLSEVVTWQLAATSFPPSYNILMLGLVSLGPSHVV